MVRTACGVLMLWCSKLNQTRLTFWEVVGPLPSRLFSGKSVIHTIGGRGSLINNICWPISSALQCKADQILRQK